MTMMIIIPNFPNYKNNLKSQGSHLNLGPSGQKADVLPTLLRFSVNLIQDTVTVSNI